MAGPRRRTAILKLSARTHIRIRNGSLMTVGLARIRSLHCGMPKVPCQLGCGRPAMRKVPEPRNLPFGEVARAGLDQGNGVGEILFSGKMRNNLLVTQGLAGFLAWRLPGRQKPPHFIDQSSGKHGFHAPIDAVVELRPRQVEPQNGEAILWGLPTSACSLVAGWGPLPLPLADRLARQFESLQCANDAAKVIGMQP